MLQGQPLPRSQLRSVRCWCRYVYNAVQTDLIDGVITEASTQDDFKRDEVANSDTFAANLGGLSFYAVMNKRVIVITIDGI